MTRRLKPTLFLATLAVGLAAAASLAHAELIVLRSTAPDVSVGQSLADAAPVKIPAGKSVVFVLPNGATKTVSGPYSGKAGDLTRGVAVDRELLEAVRNAVKTGGTSTKRVGALRSAAPSRRSAAPLPTTGFLGWDKIPVSADGDYCFAGSPKLVRAQTTGPETLTVVDLRSTTRAVASFSDGQSTAPWPSQIAAKTGGTYALMAPGAAMHQIRLRQISPIPAADETLRVLHGQRCLAQMQAWLRGMMTAQR